MNANPTNVANNLTMDICAGIPEFEEDGIPRIPPDNMSSVVEFNGKKIRANFISLKTYPHTPGHRLDKDKKTEVQGLTMAESDQLKEKTNKQGRHQDVTGRDLQ